MVYKAKKLICTDVCFSSEWSSLFPLCGRGRCYSLHLTDKLLCLRWSAKLMAQVERSLDHWTVSCSFLLQNKIQILRLASSRKGILILCTRNVFLLCRTDWCEVEQINTKTFCCFSWLDWSKAISLQLKFFLFFPNPTLCVWI